MNILEGRLSLKGDKKIAIIQIQSKEPKRAFIYLQRQRAKPKLAKKSFIKSRIFKRQTNTPWH